MRSEAREAPEGPHYEIEARFSRAGHASEEVYATQTMLAAPGGAVSMEAVRQIAYIQDFDVEMSGDDFVTDPIIGSMQEGLSLNVAVAADPRKPSRAWVAFRVVSADLADKIRTREVRWAANMPSGTVQLPRVTIAEEAGLRSAVAGEAFRLASVPAPDGSGMIDIDVLVRPVGDVGQVSWTAEREVEPQPVDESQLGLTLPSRPLSAMLRDAVEQATDMRSLQVELVSTRHSLPLYVPIAPAEARRLLGGDVRTLRSLELTSNSVAGSLSQHLTQASYVQDYDSVEGGTPIHDPVIGTMQWATAAATRVIDGRMQLELLYSELAGMPDFESELSKGHTVTIELPELRLLQARIDLVSGRVEGPVGGGPIPKGMDLDLSRGRVLLPLGKYIYQGPDGDAVGTIAVWIERRGQ